MQDYSSFLDAIPKEVLGMAEEYNQPRITVIKRQGEYEINVITIYTEVMFWLNIEKVKQSKEKILVLSEKMKAGGQGFIQFSTFGQPNTSIICGNDIAINAGGTMVARFSKELKPKFAVMLMDLANGD